MNFQRLILRDPEAGGGGGGAETVEQLEASAISIGEKYVAAPTQELKTQLSEALTKYYAAVKATSAATATGEIKPEAYKGLQADLHRQKEIARKLQDEKAALELAKKQQEERQQIEQGEFKKLWETEKQEKAAAKKQSDDLLNAYVRDKKMSVLQEAAIKAGMRPETLADLTNIDTSAVETNVITGNGEFNVDVKGAAEFIEALRATRPWIFGKPGHVALKDNNGNPLTKPEGIPAPGSLKGQELLKFEKEHPVEYKQYLHQMLNGVAVKA